MMVTDLVRTAGKEIRFKIFRNIGTAFVRMGQYQDAIGAYETVMQGSPDAGTGFNLVLCYYATQDTAQMKKAFTRLVAIPINVSAAASALYVQHVILLLVQPVSVDLG